MTSTISRVRVHIAAASDMHGQLGFQWPECDVGIINGDLVPLYSSAEEWKQYMELDWLKRKALKKLETFRSKCRLGMIFVPGNHDILFQANDTCEEAVQLLESIGITYMDEMSDVTIFNKVSFAAFPLTPTIHDRNWAFSYPKKSGYVRAAAANIPDCDVLICHGPPQGLLDTKRRFGCPNLMHRLLEISPQLVLAGHIHEERGRSLKYFNMHGDECKIVNTSLMDPQYQIKGMRIREEYAWNL